MNSKKMENGTRQLTLWSVAGSRDCASLSASQESERERTMTATSGRKCFELYGKFSRHGLSLKTFVDCLLSSGAWFSGACALTWKPMGTKCSRLLFRLVPSMRRTEGKEFSLLPTVQTQGLKVCNQDGKTEFLNPGLLPTPTASETTRAPIIVTGKNKSDHPRARSASLQDLAVSGLLSTPQAADANKTTKTSHQNNLNKTFRTGGTSRLNPLFVTEMMGFPADWLVSPFLDGETQASEP